MFRDGLAAACAESGAVGWTAECDPGTPAVGGPDPVVHVSEVLTPRSAATT